MIIDHTLVFSDQQAITVSAASTNIWDTLAVGLPYGWVSPRTPDRGEGYAEIPMLVQVTEVFATLTSLSIALEMDDNPAFSSPTVVATTGPVLTALLVPGYRARLLSRMPKGVTERYIRLNYTVAGASATTGKIFAAVTGGNQSN